MGVESLTYVDLADRLGTSQEAARSFVRRLRLPRQTGNDGKVRIHIDLAEIQHKPLPARSPGGHRADFERERDRSDGIMAEALRLTKIAMSARETAARLEGELSARQSRSWWRRLAD